MSNLLKNALKALFTKSSTIASTDKIPFNDSEGNAKGQVSISDLQQVLGGLIPYGSNITNAEQFNNIDITKNRIYRVGATIIFPSNGALVLNFVANDFKVQIAIEAEDYRAPLKKIRATVTNAFADWYDM